jgi:hypothetical protein
MPKQNAGAAETGLVTGSESEHHYRLNSSFSAKSHWPVLLTNEDFIGELNIHHTAEGQQYAAATATHSSHCSSSSSATLGRKQSPHGRDHLDKVGMDWTNHRTDIFYLCFLAL